MLDLKALNESFDRINSIKTSGKLFEYFCEDCSESGIDKEDILDWLSAHEQLWNDCEKHFVQDPTWLSADELEGFICDHDQACKDYADAFGLSFGEEEEFDESCTESFDRFLTEAKISPEDKHDSDLIRSIYAKINQKPRRNVEKRLTPEEKAVIDKYNIDLERKYWSGLYGFNTDGEGKLYSITPTVDGVELLEPRTRKHSVDISKANLADKARKTIARDHDNQFYQPIFTYDDGWKYGDRISQTFSKDKKDLENIKKEEPYSDSERKKAINNFYKDRFGKTPKQEALSEGKVTLFCELENYSRYAFDTHRKVKATGKDHLEALKKLVDNLNLYITSDIIEEEDYTFEDAIKFISNVNGDGCDWITKLTDNKGNTFIEEEAYEDDWEDLDEGKAFDFDKLNKKLHGNVRV